MPCVMAVVKDALAAITSAMQRAGLSVPAERRSIPSFKVTVVNEKPDAW